MDEVLTVDSSGLELHVEIASKIVESGYLARKIEILLLGGEHTECRTDIGGDCGALQIERIEGDGDRLNVG